MNEEIKLLNKIIGDLRRRLTLLEDKFEQHIVRRDYSPHKSDATLEDY